MTDAYGKLRGFSAGGLQGCQANVVTMNTLIDVYGKMGQWEQALGVHV